MKEYQLNKIYTVNVYNVALQQLIIDAPNNFHKLPSLFIEKGCNLSSYLKLCVSI